MLRSLSEFLDTFPKAYTFTLGIALLAAIGGLDLLAVQALSGYALLYLIPIVLVSWYVDNAAGMGVAVISLVYRLMVDFSGHGMRQGYLEPIEQLFIPGIVFLGAASVTAQLRKKFDRLARMATTDLLTGLPNSSAFWEIAAREAEQCDGLSPLTLVYIDIGGLERINRSLGHANGDQALSIISQVVRESTSRPECLARVGGTTFALLLPNVGLQAGQLTVQSLEKQLHEARSNYLLTVTFTISAMSYTKAPRSVAELMHEAEVRLHRSRRHHQDALSIVEVDSVAALN